MTPDANQFRGSIFCADVGSVARGNFGWARKEYPLAVEARTGEDMSALAQAVAQDLNCGLRVSLGFECPLFVPIAESPKELTKARGCDGNRPWSAGAGCGALATGLPQTVWILREIRTLLRSESACFLEWPLFLKADRGLFLWEAFVTGSKKGTTHVSDATIGVEAFAKEVVKSSFGARACEGDVYSLLGAAVLRSGWSKVLDLLSKEPVVVRA